MVKIRLCQDYNNEQWDNYVRESRNSSLYHLFRWKKVIEKSFGHKTFYLLAEDEQGIKGVLPLALFSSRLFGRFFISLPFFNYGGICADNQEAKELLLQEAINIAKRERAEHIELRHFANNGLSLPTKTKKVAMVLPLTDNPQDVWNGFKAKVRNQVRKAEKSGLRVEVKGTSGLDDFYRIFALNMRDLGTPVYGKNLFSNILEEFPETTNIFCVYLENKVIASGLTIGFRDTLEAPSAASLKEYRSLCPNNLLYWKMIEYACVKGYRYFDFGRSSVDSGTFRFKKQWGGQPRQLYWQYWLRDGDSLPQINPDNAKYRLAIKLWRKMPVAITKIIGPKIVRNLP